MPDWTMTSKTNGREVGYRAKAVWSWLPPMHSEWVLTNRMYVSSSMLICRIHPRPISKKPDVQGRDGQKAYAVLLYAKSDKATLNKRITDTFPRTKEYIRKVYEDVNYYFQMAMGDGLGCTPLRFNLMSSAVTSSISHVPSRQCLENTDTCRISGIYRWTRQCFPILFTIHRDELYKLRETDPETEKLLNVILRSYTGLFTDYAYITKTLWPSARDWPANAFMKFSWCWPAAIYCTIFRARRHLTLYIPVNGRRPADFAITRDIYAQERKESYITRIKAMTEYATAEDKCRSRAAASAILARKRA